MRALLRRGVGEDAIRDSSTQHLSIHPHPVNNPSRTPPKTLIHTLSLFLFLFVFLSRSPPSLHSPSFSFSFNILLLQNNILLLFLSLFLSSCLFPSLSILRFLSLLRSPYSSFFLSSNEDFCVHFASSEPCGSSDDICFNKSRPPSLLWPSRPQAHKALPPKGGKAAALHKNGVLPEPTFRLLL